MRRSIAAGGWRRRRGRSIRAGRHRCPAPSSLRLVSVPTSQPRSCRASGRSRVCPVRPDGSRSAAVERGGSQDVVGRHDVGPGEPESIEFVEHLLAGREVREPFLERCSASCDLGIDIGRDVVADTQSALAGDLRPGVFGAGCEQQRTTGNLPHGASGRVWLDPVVDNEVLIVVAGDHRIEHRHVDVLADARHVAQAQRSEHRDRAVQRREHVAERERNVGRHAPVEFGVSGEQPRLGMDHRRVGPTFRVAARRPEAGDRQHHQSRVDRGEIGPAEATPR